MNIEDLDKANALRLRITNLEREYSKWTHSYEITDWGYSTEAMYAILRPEVYKIAAELSKSIIQKDLDRVRQQLEAL